MGYPESIRVSGFNSSRRCIICITLPTRLHLWRVLCIDCAHRWRHTWHVHVRTHILVTPLEKKNQGTSTSSCIMSSSKIPKSSDINIDTSSSLTLMYYLNSIGKLTWHTWKNMKREAQINFSPTSIKVVKVKPNRLTRLCSHLYTRRKR